MIRGFATNRLLYTIDGVRMNTAIFRAGNIQNIISLDPFAVERTEVCFGPGSVIYGSDAIGGVMGFQTREPRLSDTGSLWVSGEVLGRYATANQENTGHADINLGWKKWALVTSVTANDYGDLRMGSHGPDAYLRPFYVERREGADVVVPNDDPRVQRPSGYSQFNVLQKVRFQPSAHWDIQYGFHYSETSDYARYDRQIRLRNGLPRYGEWNYGPQTWLMNNLSASYTAPNALFDGLTLRLAQQSFGESRIDRDINKPDRHRRTEAVAAYSLNLDLFKQLGQRAKIFYGVEAVQNQVTSTGVDESIVSGVSVPGPARYPQADWASYAAYLLGQYRLSPEVDMQAGIRYNQFTLDAVFDTTFYPFPFTTANLYKGSLTGSIGWVYRPAASWLLSTNLATAFRAPNVDDLGKVFDSEAGAVTIPTPDLQAEYAYNVDVGVAKVFNDRLKMDVSLYYTLLDNALVRRDFTLNGQDSILYDGTPSQAQAVQNAAQARVYGVQLGLEVQLVAGLRFSSDFSYQHGEEELDDGTTSPARHAAPWFGVSRLTYQHKKLVVQAYSQYSGQRTFANLPEEERGKTEIYAPDANGNPYAPAWYTVNLKATYQVSPLLTLSGGLENLTDQRYRPYSSGIAAAGRNVVLAGKVAF